jgi:O-antigen ligase
MLKLDNIKDKIIEYFVYIFISLFPFINLNYFAYGGTSTRSMALILLTTVFGIAVSISLFKKSSSIVISKSPIVVVLILYFISLIISGVFGLNPSISFWSVSTRTSGLWYLLNLGIFIGMISRIVADRVKQDRLILLLVLSTAVYSVLSLLSPEGLKFLFDGYSSDAFTFGNSTFAGMYIFGAFVLSIYYLLKSEKKKIWMYVLPLVLIINPNILNGEIWFGNFSKGFVGEARASSYVILISLLLMFIIWGISKIKTINKQAKVAYTFFAISIILVIISSISLLSSEGYLRKVYLSQASSARPLVWELSNNIISQRPFLGWGMDNFDRVYEVNYNNKLLQDEYGNEPWFDRAHNVLIDQTVDNGFVGLFVYFLVYVITIYILIQTSLKLKDSKDRILSCMVLVYLSLHFVELQTAFDTSISYPMLGFMLAVAINLNHRLKFENGGDEYVWKIHSPIKYIIAVLALIALFLQFFIGWLPFVRAQIANYNIAIAGSSEKRIKEYPALFGSPIDKHSFLWIASTELQKGISRNPSILSDPVKNKELKLEFAQLEKYYRDYVNDNTSHFRAKLNFAEVLIFQRLFGVNRLDEAQKILDEAIKLVPQAPQPYWMKAVAYVYMKKFDQARQYANIGLNLNPQITDSQKVVEYVDESIKSFPNIDLFFFKKI